MEVRSSEGRIHLGHEDEQSTSRPDSSASNSNPGGSRSKRVHSFGSVWRENFAEHLVKAFAAISCWKKVLQFFLPLKWTISMLGERGAIGGDSPVAPIGRSTIESVGKRQAPDNPASQLLAFEPIHRVLCYVQQAAQRILSKAMNRSDQRSRSPAAPTERLEKPQRGNNRKQLQPGSDSEVLLGPARHADSRTDGDRRTRVPQEQRVLLVTSPPQRDCVIKPELPILCDPKNQA